MKRKVPETMTACFDLIENDMFKGPWVMGETYTVADGYLLTVTRWARADGVDAARHPRIEEHMQRMNASDRRSRKFWQAIDAAAVHRWRGRRMTSPTVPVAGSDPARRPPYAVLIAISAVGPLALNMFMPSIPGLQATFSASTGAVQLTLTVYLAGDGSVPAALRAAFGSLRPAAGAARGDGAVRCGQYRLRACNVDRGADRGPRVSGARRRRRAHTRARHGA